MLRFHAARFGGVDGKTVQNSAELRWNVANEVDRQKKITLQEIVRQNGDEQLKSWLLKGEGDASSADTDVSWRLELPNDSRVVLNFKNGAVTHQQPTITEAVDALWAGIRSQLSDRPEERRDALTKLEASLSKEGSPRLPLQMQLRTNIKSFRGLIDQSDKLNKEIQFFVVLEEIEKRRRPGAGGGGDDDYEITKHKHHRVEQLKLAAGAQIKWENVCELAGTDPDPQEAYIKVLKPKSVWREMKFSAFFSEKRLVSGRQLTTDYRRLISPNPRFEQKWQAKTRPGALLKSYLEDLREQNAIGPGSSDFKNLKELVQAGILPLMLVVYQETDLSSIATGGV